MTQEALAQMMYVYKAFSKEFYGTEDIDFAKGNPIVHMEADVESVLFKAENMDETVAKIYLTAVKAGATTEALTEVEKMINKSKKSAAIRHDWPAAFRKVKNGRELSSVVNWGFYKDDLRTFLKLHKANRFRKKIEDLLTDCNYHTFCGYLSVGEYDNAKEHEEL
jgi:hypothetical protein